MTLDQQHFLWRCLQESSFTIFDNVLQLRYELVAWDMSNQKKDAIPCVKFCVPYEELYTHSGVHALLSKWGLVNNPLMELKYSQAIPNLMASMQARGIPKDVFIR